jgi:50S ribosomal subunit-associated GTPase HflX
VFNKADRSAKDSAQSDGLRISAKTGAGVDALKAQLAKMLA